MTSKNSLCIKCGLLDTYTDALVTPDGSDEPLLISRCLYGGVNAGNRKQCKHFEQASTKTIDERLEVFKEFRK